MLLNLSDFQIITDPDGSHHASNGVVGMSVLKDGITNLFKRRALKNAMTPNVQTTSWLVGEIDGVKCYVKQEGLRLNIVMTKQDLWP